SAHLEMPEWLSSSRVESNEVAFGIAREDQPSSSRQDSGPCRRCMAELPLHFPGLRRDGAQSTPIRFSFIRGKVRAAIVGVPCFVGLRRGAEDVALLTRGHIEEARLRVEAGRHPVRCAQGSGANGVALWRR